MVFAMIGLAVVVLLTVLALGVLGRGRRGQSESLDQMDSATREAFNSAQRSIRG